MGNFLSLFGFSSTQVSTNVSVLNDAKANEAIGRDFGMHFGEKLRLKEAGHEFGVEAVRELNLPKRMREVRDIATISSTMHAEGMRRFGSVGLDQLGQHFVTMSENGVDMARELRDILVKAFLALMFVITYKYLLDNDYARCAIAFFVCSIIFFAPYTFTFPLLERRVRYIAALLAEGWERLVLFARNPRNRPFLMAAGALIGLLGAVYFRKMDTSRIRFLFHKKSVRSSVLYVVGSGLAIGIVAVIGKLAAAYLSLRPFTALVMTIASTIRISCAFVKRALNVRLLILLVIVVLVSAALVHYKHA